MAQRISRGKQRIKAAGARFAMPPRRASSTAAAGRAARALSDLQRGLHRFQRAGSAAWRADRGGDPAHPRAARAAARRRRGDRAAGAHAAHRRAPGRPHRRRTARWSRWPSRTAPGGTGRPSPRGSRSITEALTWSPPGPYQLQAAIAAVHAEAARAEDTDWPQIVALYRLLSRVAPEPDGHPQPRRPRSRWSTGRGPGSTCCAPLDDDERMAGHHRLAAVRAHLLEHGRRPRAPLGRRTGRRPGGRPACPSSGIWRAEPPGSPRSGQRNDPDRATGGRQMLIKVASCSERDGGSAAWTRPVICVPTPSCRSHGRGSPSSVRAPPVIAVHRRARPRGCGVAQPAGRRTRRGRRP